MLEWVAVACVGLGVFGAWCGSVALGLMVEVFSSVIGRLGFWGSVAWWFVMSVEAPSEADEDASVCVQSMEGMSMWVWVSVGGLSGVLDDIWSVRASVGRWR